MFAPLLREPGKKFELWSVSIVLGDLDSEHGSVECRIDRRTRQAHVHTPNDKLLNHIHSVAGNWKAVALWSGFKPCYFALASEK